MRIDGGSGHTPGGIGSIGVSLLGQSKPVIPFTFQGCRIDGGQGVAANGVGSLGVEAGNVSGLVITDSDIDGGTSHGESSATSLITYGATIAGGTGLEFARNRVLVHPVSGASKASRASVAVAVSAVESATIHSNVLAGVGADVSGGTSFALQVVAGTDSNGLYSTPTKQVSVVNNTLIAGTHSPDASSAALQVVGPHEGLVVNGNLLVAVPLDDESGPGRSAALILAACSQDSIASFSGNALVLPPSALALFVDTNETGGTPCVMPGDFTTGALVIQALKANNAKLTPDVLTIGDCPEPSDSTCTPVAECTSSAACMSSIFASISSDDLTATVPTDGLRLSRAPPACSVPRA